MADAATTIDVAHWLAPEFAPPSSRPLTFTAGRLGRLVWHNSEGRIIAVCERMGDLDRVTVPGVATFSAHARPPIVVEPCEGALAATIDLTFEKFALPMLLQARGFELVHASAVRSASGVVAFCGESGAGKSTLAHGLATRGYEAWADDVVALDFGSACVTAVRLPFRWRLGPPGTAVAATRTANGSSVAPVHALVVLERATNGVRSEELSPASAFRSVFPHAMCFDLSDAQRNRVTLERHFDLCAKVRVHQIAFAHVRSEFDALLDRVQALVWPSHTGQSPRGNSELCPSGESWRTLSLANGHTETG